MTDNNSAPAAQRKVMQPRAMFFLNLANHAIRNRLDAALNTVNMTSIQYTVLSVIGAKDGLSSAELSRSFFVTPQTMNELIAGLHRQMLISRNVDPNNRRILRMSLTEAGRKKLQQCDILADDIEQNAFSSFSDEDYQKLADLTRTLSRNLRKVEPSET